MEKGTECETSFFTFSVLKNCAKRKTFQTTTINSSNESPAPRRLDQQRQRDHFDGL